MHNHEAGSEQSDDITILAFDFFTREAIESYDISISNNIDSLSEVLVAFESFSEKYTLAMPISQKMSIALDDILNNIISYAYSDDKEHTIDIRFEYSKDELCVDISDDGIPFNPFDESSADTTLSMDEREIGGLGIHLIKNMIDKYSYSRKINKNIVTLRMYLSQTISQKDDNV